MFHTFNLSMAASSKIGFLEGIGSVANKRIIMLQLQGYGLKITVDNIDWRTIANQVLHSFNSRYEDFGPVMGFTARAIMGLFQVQNLITPSDWLILRAIILVEAKIL